MVDANDEHVATVRQYYASLDAHDYDALGSALDPGFVHYRPDRTFEGRERFVQFMRDERPMTDTRHELRGVFVPADNRVAVTGDTPDCGDSSPNASDDAPGAEDDAPDGSAGVPDRSDNASSEVAHPLIVVRGRLLDCDGEHVFRFVDVHELSPAGLIVATHTYTR